MHNMRKAISVRTRGTMLGLLSDLARCDTPAQSILTTAVELMKQHPEERIYSIEQTLNCFPRSNQLLTASDLDKLAKSGVSVSVDVPIHDPDEDEDEDEED